jgi:hypothetical protein
VLFTGAANYGIRISIAAVIGLIMVVEGGSFKLHQ